jgi:sulfite exporter TauE/SafE
MKEKELREKRREFLKNLGRILGYGALGGLFAGNGKEIKIPHLPSEFL